MRKGALQVPAQDALAGALIGKRNSNVSVKAASPDQRGVELVRVVAGPHHDYPFAPLQSVNALKQRCDHLGTVLGVMATKPLSVPYSVNFIKENDRGRFSARFIERVAHRPQEITKMSLGLPAAERAEDKVHATCSRQCPSESRFSRPGSSAEQDAAIHIFPPDLPCLPVCQVERELAPPVSRLP